MPLRLAHNALVAADDDLLDALSRDLARAHERVARIADAPTRARFSRRLIAVTNAAKRDLPAARRRLRELLRGLESPDEGGAREGGVGGERDSPARRPAGSGSGQDGAETSD
jgi:hypothetical protein